MWPQEGSVCGRVYGSVHSGQVRVERRWDRAADMGTVALGAGGRAIVRMLLSAEEDGGSGSAAAAAAAAAAEEEDEPPTMVWY